MSITRRLVSGTFQLTLSNCVVRLFSIVTIPILTTLLSPQTYGVAALVGTVISLVSVFALAGIDMSYARAYHSAMPPNGAGVEHYCWRFAIRAALLAAVITAVAWWLIFRDAAELDHRLEILLALGVVFLVAVTMVQTRARLEGRYRAMALSIVAVGIIGPVASIGIAVWWRQDALALILPMLLSYVVPVVLLGMPSLTLLMKPTGLPRSESIALVKIGLAGIVTAPMYWVLSSSDRWFLQYYHGAEAVGIYSIGYGIGVLGMMVNTSVMSVWLPEASREYEQDQERAKATLGGLMSRLMAVMALIWLMVAAAGGDVVRWLANERFHASAEYVPFVAAGVLFYGASQLALYGLVLVKELKWAALWWSIGGLFSTLLNFALVPLYGGVGAAMTQSVSFALISLGMLATSQAKYPIHLVWGRLVMVLSIIVAAGVVMTPSWHGSAPLSLLMKLPVGIVVASMTAWVVAPDWCARGVDYFRVMGMPRPTA